jgi:hypothetical protein
VVGDGQFSEGDWVFDPAVASLDRTIRNAFREEAEAVEADVHEADLRERNFSDVAREIRNRGDFVAIATSHRTFNVNGHVVYAARDVVTVKSESFEADINLSDIAYIKVVTRGVRKGGSAQLDGPGTFEMRLMERRSPIDRVELGYRTIGETVIGSIVAVGQDHVVMIDDHKQEWTIPLHTISWVIRRQRSRR